MIKLWVALWGIRIGTALVIAPIAYDVILKGIRSGENIKVCLLGVICQLVGLGFAWLGDRCEKSF